VRLRHAALPAALWLLAGAARAESPEVLYMLHCQGCHRPDGAGAPGSVPPLAGSVARFLAVPGGREFLVRVPGSSQSPLDDAELAAVLNWMVLRFGPDDLARAAAPFDAAEIARVRRPPLTDVAGTRRELLERIARAGRRP
jgi:mono/diheme cytochrome c family protein